MSSFKVCITEISLNALRIQIAEIYWKPIEIECRKAKVKLDSLSKTTVTALQKNRELVHVKQLGGAPSNQLANQKKRRRIKDQTKN